jgi:Tol biopolymer transport system component
MGNETNGSSGGLSLSLDGSFVAFDSNANDIVPGDPSTWLDVFVRDRQMGLTEWISVDSSGVPGNDASQAPSISGTGRYVAFTSAATNLVPNDTNSSYDVFVRDRQTATTIRASISSSGVQGDQGSAGASISNDGRLVAFYGPSSNLASGGGGFLSKIFARDLVAGTTQLVSIDSSNQPANGHSQNPSISSDGRFIAFDSGATNLVSGDTNGVSDIFVRDLQAGTTERVSVSSTNGQGNADSYSPSISADGRWVAFWSGATNLVPGDVTGYLDVFVRDRLTGITERVSVDSTGAPGDNGSRFPSISVDGRYVAFYSEATNLVAGDTNALPDIFVRDRMASGFRSICSPGQDGVAACPCSNPPGGSDRGCDNSASTGGASLSAAGAAYLSMDTIVFTTTGEKPTATSILLQGTAVLPNGAVYGQGIRCVGGSLVRLYTKIASLGSITAPDFAAGDPTVSVRSAARGDAFGPGASRSYLVYYRDPVVLGGCAASSTFNATQSGYVTWSP